MKTAKYIITFDSITQGKGFFSNPLPKAAAENALRFCKEKYGNDIYNCKIIEEPKAKDQAQ